MTQRLRVQNLCTPVFVLTHHHRPSFTLARTTFHLLDATPAAALERAKEAAGAKRFESMLPPPH